jgi:hypothetical protein
MAYLGCVYSFWWAGEWWDRRGGGFMCTCIITGGWTRAYARLGWEMREYGKGEMDGLRHLLFHPPSSAKKGKLNDFNQHRLIAPWLRFIISTLVKVS